MYMEVYKHATLKSVLCIIFFLLPLTLKFTHIDRDLEFIAETFEIKLKNFYIDFEFPLFILFISLKLLIFLPYKG